MVIWAGLIISTYIEHAPSRLHYNFKLSTACGAAAPWALFGMELAVFVFAFLIPGMDSVGSSLQTLHFGFYSCWFFCVPHLRISSQSYS